MWKIGEDLKGRYILPQFLFNLTNVAENCLRGEIPPPPQVENIWRVKFGWSQLSGVWKSASKLVWVLPYLLKEGVHHIENWTHYSPRWGLYVGIKIFPSGPIFIPKNQNDQEGFKNIGHVQKSQNKNSWACAVKTWSCEERKPRSKNTISTL